METEPALDRETDRQSPRQGDRQTDGDRALGRQTRHADRDRNTVLDRQTDR